MLHLSIPKEQFEDILTTKQKVLTKEITNYWKKELLDIRLENDKIRYDIKKIDRLKLSNGFGEDKPLMIIECLDLQYNPKQNVFEFHLGYINERRNIDLSEDYKDSLIQQLLREKEQLQDRMHRDHLTGLYNRRKMEEDLHSFVKQNNAYLLSCVFVDADRFKGINDYFGHDAGDDALCYIAHKLQKHAKRLNGEAYRFGGEEFVLLCFLPQEVLLEGLVELKEDIKAEKIPNPKRPISLTVSMGVSFWKDSKNKEHFIKVADDGVYKAKTNGRDRIEIG